jgi:hypothetical protein
MKKLMLLTVILYHGFSFSQDTTQVKHTKKIIHLLDKVNVINEEHLNNKEQVINKSKIDDLMLKIEAINKEQVVSQKEFNQDSLNKIIQFLQSSNRQKDSLIASLKIQLDKQKTYNPSPLPITEKQQQSYTHNYIVLGAYQIKANAEKQAHKLQNYQVEIIPAYANKLHYVVYKLKLKEKIEPTLNKFRNQIEPNAWHISL